MFRKQSLTHIWVFHPLLLLRQTTWTERRMGGDGEEERTDRGAEEAWWWWSFPVMHGGRSGCGGKSIFSFRPSVIHVSWKGVKTKGGVWFRGSPTVNTFPPSLTIKSLHYTYIVHTRAGCNSPVLKYWKKAAEAWKKGKKVAKFHSIQFNVLKTLLPPALVQTHRNTSCKLEK